MEWEELEKRISSFLSDLDKFRAKLIDRDDFKRYTDNLYHETTYYNEFRITGYFSEAGYKTIERITKRKDVLSVRFISPEPYFKSKRNEKNLKALRKLNDTSEKISVKVNDMMHARLFIASRITSNEGVLIVGSFDLNNECLSRERLDVGIQTKNPDLIEKAREFFDSIWNNSNSRSIENLKA